MLNLWTIAAGVLALAAAAALASRRTRRKSASEAGGVSVPSVSEQWLSEQRSQSHDNP